MQIKTRCIDCNTIVIVDKKDIKSGGKTYSAEEKNKIKKNVQKFINKLRAEKPKYHFRLVPPFIFKKQDTTISTLLWVMESLNEPKRKMWICPNCNKKQYHFNYWRSFGE